jgi:hypothetical protein
MVPREASDHVMYERADPIDLALEPIQSPDRETLVPLGRTTVSRGTSFDISFDPHAFVYGRGPDPDVW